LCVEVLTNALLQVCRQSRRADDQALVQACQILQLCLFLRVFMRVAIMLNPLSLCIYQDLPEKLDQDEAN